MSNIGENLKNLREEAGLSLSKLSKITKIQEKYLLRLENNEFEKLPNPVYIRGFIQKWANACNTTAEDLLLQFKRENEEIIKAAEDPDRLNEITTPSFVITSKHIILMIVIMAIAALSAFFYFNQKLLSEVPQVEVTVPVDFNIVTEEGTILISGETKNTEKLFINGTETFLGKDGKFELTYTLTAGLNTVVIKAKSITGKETETVRKVLKL